MSGETIQQARGSATGADGLHASVVRKVTWVGFALNIFLVAAKLIGGIYGHSQAVIADGVHSLSDCVTDLAILIGVRYWSKPPDELHPYGHRRIETLVTIGIGITLGIAGIGIGMNAITSIHDQTHGTPGILALLAAFISLVSKEILFHWTVRAGKRVRSNALIANAWHHRSDALSSLPAVIAVGGAMIYPDWAVLDHIGAILVAMFILHAAWQIIQPALHEVTDRGASEKTCNELTRLAAEVQGVISVHNVRTRYHGGGLHVDMHVEVDGAMTVEQGHDIATEIKHRLIDNGPEVLDVLVHIEPMGHVD